MLLSLQAAQLDFVFARSSKCGAHGAKTLSVSACLVAQCGKVANNDVCCMQFFHI